MAMGSDLKFEYHPYLQILHVLNDRSLHDTSVHTIVLFDIDMHNTSTFCYVPYRNISKKNIKHFKRVMVEPLGRPS